MPKKAPYDLIYDARLDLATLTLRGVLMMEDYQESWQKALDLIVKTQASRFLIDAHKQKTNPMDNQIWFKESFLKEAYERLPKHTKIARLGSRYLDIDSKSLEILRYLKSHHYDFNLRVFHDSMSATDWLLSQE